MNNMIIQRLWSLLKPLKFYLLIAIVLTFVSNALALYAPKLTGDAIDAIIGVDNVNFDVVLVNCVLMLLCFLVSALLTYALQRLLNYVSKRLTYQLRQDVFNHLQELPIRYFDTHQTGDIISRISYDIDTINTSLSSDILQLATGVITVVGSFVMMVSISLPLVGVFAITLPIAFISARYRMKKVKPLFRLRSRQLGFLNGFSEEMLSGHKTISAFNQQDSILELYQHYNEDASTAYYNAEYQASVMGPTVNFVNNLSLALISMFGALLYLFGSISIGNISSFVMYSRKFSGPINETANIITELQSAISAAERVFALIDQPSEIADKQDAQELSHVKGNVSFEHVYFSYDSSKEILHDVCFDISEGKTLAIVGPTGAGKTTIINLLMRFYDINNGIIKIDGKSIYDVTRQSLRKAFTLVLQDTWLFGGTVKENIAYANPNASDQIIMDVCKKAYIHEFIMSLPNGYDTILTDDGITISKGQKQLMTIARAMLSTAPILILDEATSNVDSRTEQLIQQAMFSLMHERTCIVIAHRLSTIQNADKILVLNHGSVIEEGNHQSLLDSHGFYAKLFNAQFES